MRLLAVRQQNLNSLSGEPVVRFDEVPLSAAGVGVDHGADVGGGIDLARCDDAGLLPGLRLVAT